MLKSHRLSTTNSKTFLPGYDFIVDVFHTDIIFPYYPRLVIEQFMNWYINPMTCTWIRIFYKQVKECGIVKHIIDIEECARMFNTFPKNIENVLNNNNYPILLEFQSFSK
jgi:hypothetical protein